MPTSKWIRALAALAIIVAPALARAAAPAPARNLLSNPGFERTLPGHEWMAAGWDTSDAGLPTVFFGRDTLAPHSGHYSVNVANTSTLYTLGHNWSQAVFVGREAWNKEAVFSVWTRSSGQQGRAYVLVQAYADSLTKLARLWGVDRDEARTRLGINSVDDPVMELGWRRAQFDDTDTQWVRREVRVFVPAGTNVLFVRGGLFGTGQVSFDDASLTLAPAPPAPVVALGQNLFADPGFEDGGLAWEWAIPPYEGLRIEIDSTVTHGGRRSARFSNLSKGISDTRRGMCQPISARGLAGKRVRSSGWVRGDCLSGAAFVKVYCQTLHGLTQSPGTQMLSDTFDWTQTATELDVPSDAIEIWAWLAIRVPAAGALWMDDGRFEVIGPATDTASPTAAPTTAPKAKRAQPAGKAPAARHH